MTELNGCDNFCRVRQEPPITEVSLSDGLFLPKTTQGSREVGIATVGRYYKALCADRTVIHLI